jgi:nucleotide-binding universal stress UspA family protein
MIKINNILCPVDFSKVSSKVASFSQSLAQNLNAGVYVLNVVPSYDQFPYFGMLPNEFQEFLDEALADAEQAIETFIRENFIIKNVSGKVLSGYTAEVILNFAAAEGIDLIIMGTHGRRGVNKIVFGSTAEKVVKSSRVPVLTVRPD